MSLEAPDDALPLIAFWRAAGRKAWFSADATFDGELRARFGTLHEQAMGGARSSSAAGDSCRGAAIA